MLKKLKNRFGFTRQSHGKKSGRFTDEAPSTVLDADLNVQLEQMELISRRIVDGVLTGLHRSTHRGGTCEFLQHRQYSPGDELRLIDWQVYARNDRYYVRQFQQETNLKALVLLDASGSMRFKQATNSKFDVGRQLAAALSRLMLRQRDEVGLAIVQETECQFLPPRGKVNHLSAILSRLVDTKPSGEVNLPLSIHQFGQRLSQRGMIFILSDFFTDVPALAESLKRMRARGHDVFVIQILAPEELSFDFPDAAIFQSLELSDQRIDVDPVQVREAYLKEFKQFLANLNQAVTETGCDFLQIQTDEDLANVLKSFLKSRRGRPASRLIDVHSQTKEAS